MNIILKDKIDSTKEKPLIDIYRRHIHKLRVQLTDACNFRCFYCMPTNVKFKKASELLTPKIDLEYCQNIPNRFITAKFNYTAETKKNQMDRFNCLKL